MNVSIIIPTFNRAHFITKAVESVLAQTYSDYEIIIIDDGSTDNTKDILKPYNSKIRYIYQENSGVSSARNHGIKASKGNWIAFLDSDDLWHPEKLETQLKVAKDPNTIYLHRAEWFIDDDKDEYLMRKADGVNWPQTDEHSLIVNPILSIARAEPYMTPAIMCHKSCFEDIGLFDEHLSAGEDEDWLSRASLTYNFFCQKESLALIRYHQGQTGLGSEKSVKSLITVMKRMQDRVKGIDSDAYDIANKRLSNRWSQLATIYFQQGLRSDSIRAAWRAYSVRPKNLKRIVKLCTIALGLYKK